MPGIFGLVSAAPRETLVAQAAAMARRLRHHPWYVEDCHADAETGVALGRVGLGFLDTAKQPAVNENNSLRAVLTGEVLDYDQSRQSLSAAGHTFGTASHAELVLHGFESAGQRFFDGLDGTFAAAIWDNHERRLILINDRFGMKNLYYAHLPGRLLFASEIKALLVDGELSRRLSDRGIAQFFTYGHLLAEDTLLESIHLLPAGGWLTYDAREDGVHLERWIRRRPVPQGSHRPANEVLDEIDAALLRAVRRRSCGQERLGLSLSGGLDARTLLGLIDSGTPLTTVTLGMPGSIDVASATEMARLTGRTHRTCALDSAFLGDYEQHMRHMVHLTDGQYLSQCIIMPTLPLYRELGIEILLRGHAGELMHMDKAYNFSLDKSAWKLHDEASLEEWLFTRLRAYMLEGVGEDLFAPPYRGHVAALARDTLRECLRESQAMDHPVNRIAQLFLAQRVRRDTALSMMEFGSVVETRLPYLDAGLVDCLFAAPPELRVGDTIQAHILRRHRPELLGVVNANTGTRLGAGRIRRAFHTLCMKVLAKLGVQGYQPYERLGLWLREDLRPLVEGLLLSERCLQRGVFDPDVLSGVVDRHIHHGRNHTYLLLALMVFELGQREFVDGEDVQTPVCRPADGQLQRA